MRGRRQLEPREWLALALGLAVAAAALTPLGWLALRGAEAGGLDALLGVVTRDSGATVARSAALSFGVAALCVALALPAAWLTEATDLPGRRLVARADDVVVDFHTVRRRAPGNLGLARLDREVGGELGHRDARVPRGRDRYRPTRPHHSAARRRRNQRC